MKKRILKKEIPAKVTNIKIESVDALEEVADKPSDELFDVSAEKKEIEYETAKGKTMETFWAYSTQDKRKQMRWFVNKLISLCDDPYSIHPHLDYGEYLFFEVDSLRDSLLFPFGVNGATINKYDYIRFTRQMLLETKRNIYKLKDMGFSFNTDHFTWYNETGEDVWQEENIINHEGDFYMDIYFRPLFEAYLKFMDSNERVIENGKEKPRVSIEKIEVLEDKTEQGRVCVYINSDYENPVDHARNISWGNLYELAKNQRIAKDKNFLSYFNYNSANPLYTPKGGFIPTAVLKNEDEYTVPNIEIKLITKEKVSRRLN